MQSQSSQNSDGALFSHKPKLVFDRENRWKTPAVGHLLRAVEPVNSNASCERVLHRFLNDRDLSVQPIVDDSYRPVALVDRKEYIEFFSRVYTREVFGRRKIIEFFAEEDYLSNNPIIVEHTCSVSDVAQIVLKRGLQHMITGFVIVDQGRYLGVADGSDLLRSITERRQEELVKFNAELELRVKERTAELESANAQLESFSYTIAHDLRGPVRAMNGYSEMLLARNEDRLDLKSVEFIRRVVAGSQRMAALIDDLLGFARLSRQDMRREVCDLGKLANAVIANLDQENPTRKVDVTIHSGMSAICDTGLMHAALENLIGNAWKYTSKIDHARIEFGNHRHDGQIIYYVRDNGAGFDMQYAGKLFKPFQRLHHANEFEGTGIGLATVQKIVERHGGRVWIEGAVNKGTTVFFTIGESI